MASVLIRGVPDDVLAVIEAKARRLGVSRTEYLRRTLLREGSVAGSRVTEQDLSWFAETFSDLADEDVMRRAWE